MDGQPSEKLMANFEKRDDGQRMSLEVWAQDLKGRTVIVYSDNKGSEVHPGAVICYLHLRLPCCHSQGIAKSWDHCQVIHEIWSHVRLAAV